MNDTFNAKIHILYLRIFDVVVTVTSDSRQFIKSFGLVFQRFSVNAPNVLESAGCLIECAVFTKGSNEWGRPVIIIDREIYPVHNPSLMEGYACEKIIIAAFSKVRSHFLAHAGVVSHHGDGVVIIADAEHGKTTLTLELVKRGFTFLSDALARFEALCREYEILVLDTVKGHRARPTFESPARLEAIPKTTAVFELMGHFQSGYTSEIVQKEFQGNANRLFMEFSAMVNHAGFYQLFVGPLGQMADGICSLVAQGFSPDRRLHGTSR